jgi:putative flippase GtrA
MGRNLLKQPLINYFIELRLQIGYIFAGQVKLIHEKIRTIILNLVDFFYPPFKPFMPLQTYRYAACGGGNTAFNILVFFITHNFILQNKVLHIGSIAISSHVASFLIAFCITFPIGFYLSMYVVFHGSYLRRRIQLVRYFAVALACIFLNYIFLKLFVDTWGWYPTPSMILTTVIVVIFSYLSQKHFSFKKEKLDIHLK